MTSLGLLYPNRETWFYALRDLYAFLATLLLVSSTIWEFLSPFLAYPTYERIQARKTMLPLYLEEIRDALLCHFVIATLSAWPLAMQRDGYTTAFKKTIGEAAFFDSYMYYALKIVVTAIWADAWTFWKHYCFHHPSVYAIHKGHHVYHNPSTYAGFAIHPVEAFWTFCPILAMCVP
jgi:lathosterol oxidase